MIWAVIPAAGSGRRFGSALPKQYADIDGRTVLEWTLSRLAAVPRVEGLMVVLSASDQDWPGLQNVADKPVRTAVGGAELADSVLAGLRALPQDVALTDYVLVHDAARPCVRVSDIDRLIDQVLGSTGGLLATPVRDTLKREAEPDRHVDQIRVAHSVTRSGLWRALTPQMFRRGALTQALDSAHAQGMRPTDEAQAMELQGVHPVLVEACDDNIKVTTAQDLLLAQFLLRAQGSA